MTQELPGYWYSRWLFERGLAAIYLIGFIVAINQFVPLLGDRGLLPVSRFVREVPFRASPSLFFLLPTDRAFRAAAWLGVVLSAVALTGIVQRRGGLATAALGAALWLLVFSLVNVGARVYAGCWESLLLAGRFFTSCVSGSTN